MRVFYSKRFPPKGFAAINLFGVIIGRSEYGRLTKYELNHEKIHTRQIVEMLWVFFYVFYFAEWTVRFVQYRDPIVAYYNISFEREAYNNDKNLNYLKDRKWYSSFKYIGGK
ncbi:MAG: hypothetical protein E6772_12095 [Dysgonomonas sp.]|nr:hypothetical protein [Dysgonomonas sp.]